MKRETAEEAAKKYVVSPSSNIKSGILVGMDNEIEAFIAGAKWQEGMSRSGNGAGTEKRHCQPGDKAEVKIPMNIQELKINNYVGNAHDFPMYITALFADGTVYLDFDGNEGDVWEEDVKDLNPIPLTEELILRLGFTKMLCEDRITRYTKKIIIQRNEPVEIPIAYALFRTPQKDSQSIALIEEPGCKPLMYLHELQNSWYSLTSQSLEVPENAFVK